MTKGVQHLKRLIRFLLMEFLDFVQSNQPRQFVLAALFRRTPSRDLEPFPSEATQPRGPPVAGEARRPVIPMGSVPVGRTQVIFHGPSSRPPHESRARSALLDLALEVLALDQVGDLIIVLALLALLHVLVALGKLAERSERVGAKLVKDAGNKLGKLLVLAVAVDGKGVGGNGGVDWSASVERPPKQQYAPRDGMYAPLGAAK